MLVYMETNANTQHLPLIRHDFVVPPSPEGKGFGTLINENLPFQKEPPGT